MQGARSGLVDTATQPYLADLELASAGAGCALAMPRRYGVRAEEGVPVHWFSFFFFFFLLVFASVSVSADSRCFPPVNHRPRRRHSRRDTSNAIATRTSVHSQQHAGRTPRSRRVCSPHTCTRTSSRSGHLPFTSSSTRDSHILPCQVFGDGPCGLDGNFTLLLACRNVTAASRGRGPPARRRSVKTSVMCAIVGHIRPKR